MSPSATQNHTLPSAGGGANLSGNGTVTVGHICVKIREIEIFGYLEISRLARRGEGWAPYPGAATSLPGNRKGSDGRLTITGTSPEGPTKPSFLSGKMAR